MDKLLISELLPPVSGVAKTRKKKYENKIDFGEKRSSSPALARAELASDAHQQPQLRFTSSAQLGHPTAWCSPQQRYQFPQGQRKLTVYLPHMYLVPRVIALPGQHFSHFASKSGMTNQCVIHVFLSSRNVVQSISIPNGYDKGGCFYSELGPSPPGGILEVEQHWMDTLKVTSPQWDTLGDMHLPRSAASPGRRRCRSPHFTDHFPT